MVPGVDAGTAAVLGATVGALATIVVGVVALIPPALTRRRERTDAHRRELTELLAETISAIIEWPRSHDPEVTDAARVRYLRALAAYGMIAEPHERPAILVLSTAAYCTEYGSDTLRASAQGTLAANLPAWHAGTYPVEKLARDRLNLVNAARDEGLTPPERD